MATDTYSTYIRGTVLHTHVRRRATHAAFNQICQSYSLSKEPKTTCSPLLLFTLLPTTSKQGYARAKCNYYFQSSLVVTGISHVSFVLDCV